MKTLILILTLIVAGTAQAEYLSAHEVSQLFYSAKCDQECQGGVTIESFQARSLATLPESLYRGLKSVALDLAQIWEDTILEGDYTADGKTILDQVLIIKKDGLVIGYSITYSEHAWFTGNCNYDYSNPSTLQSCQAGRISETTFVSSDLNTKETDQNQFADFHAKD
jgi:hypothetical protein